MVGTNQSEHVTQKRTQTQQIWINKHLQLTLHPFHRQKMRDNMKLFFPIIEYVMGESACTLTVLDVADALQSGYAYISGGKSPSGHPILTFPDNHESGELSDEDYKSIISYLTSIPPYV